MNDLTINQLPLYSPWPARLLGLETWTPREKTPDEITREYEHEKWGPLLARVRSAGAGVTLEQAVRWAVGETGPSLFCSEESFELLPPFLAYERYVDFVCAALSEYATAPALVELGAGYGAILLNLARRREFAEKQILAGEYTASGEELIRLLASVEGLKVRSGRCDFSRMPVCDFDPPAGALIYTSYATPYVRELGEGFVEGLAAFCPRAVVHVEPCREHCDSNTLMGLMRQRYIDVNGYNRNLVTLLRAQEQAGKIRILSELPAVIGINPLLAASVVAWAPTR
jgi:hypothetical protein